MFINRLYCCFLAGVEYRTKDNNQVIKRSKILFNKVYARVSWIRPTTRVGKTGYLHPPQSFQASL